MLTYKPMYLYVGKSSEPRALCVHCGPTAFLRTIENLEQAIHKQDQPYDVELKGNKFYAEDMMTLLDNGYTLLTETQEQSLFLGFNEKYIVFYLLSMHEHSHRIYYKSGSPILKLQKALTLLEKAKVSYEQYAPEFLAQKDYTIPDADLDVYLHNLRRTYIEFLPEEARDGVLYTVHKLHPSLPKLTNRVDEVYRACVLYNRLKPLIHDESLFV